MLEENYSFRIIGEDDFNIKSINESLWSIRENIFENLYDVQKSLTNIYRFDFKMSEFSNKDSSSVRYNIPIQFIHNKSRIAYRHSPFYKRLLTYEDVFEHPDLFLNTIMVFIDGQLYTNYSIQPMEDITSIVFKLYLYYPTHDNYVVDGFLRKDFNKLLEKDSNVTIIMMSTHREEDNKLNRYTLLNYTNVPKFMGVPMVDFIRSNNITTNDPHITFITTDDDQLYKYDIIDTSISDGKLYPDPRKVNILNNTYTNLKNIYPLNYLTKLTIKPGLKYFEIPLQDMPVPIENLIVFRNNGGKIYFDHTASITMYYPNIYEVNRDHDDELIIYCYYADDTLSVGNKYFNELQLYYRFIHNIVDRYENNTIPEIIKNYKPVTVSYDIKDYTSQSADHLIYKFNKLQDIIRQDGYYYYIYLNKLVGYVPRYYIDLDTMNDLITRYRTDNKNEIKDPSLWETFDEPCYLFIFRKDNNNDRIILFIDNKHFHPRYDYTTQKYRYVYIPTRLINTNTIIDVEKYTDEIYMMDIIAENTDSYIEIDYTKEYQIRPDEIFVTYEDNGQAKYLDRDYYELYHLQNGQYDLITRDKFYKHYNSIFIKITNELFINLKLTVITNNCTFTMESVGSNVFEINKLINNNIHNLMLFKNGKLVPYDASHMTFSEYATGPHRFRSLVSVSDEDVFTLVYNPNKYTRVYYASEIDSKGLVDLYDEIEKPLSFKWYDFYLNGNRLTKSNIDIIAPYAMIISGVNTRLNLEIFDKNFNDSVEYITHDDIDDEILDLIMDDILNDLSEIENKEDDILQDVIIDAVGFLEDYLFSFGLLNPDIQQILNNMTDEYPRLFDSRDNLIFNADKKIKLDRDIFFNPDTQTY